MATKKNLTKEEWEAMTGTDMSLILPSDGSIETARESSLNDTGQEKSEGTVEQTDFTFEPQQPSTGKEEAIPASQRRISSRQRKLSLEEYRKTFLQVPRIEDRKPVFVSGEVRDRLDEFVRRLGGRKMSVSGLLETSPGSILKSTRKTSSSGESCDIFRNDRLAY